MQFLVVMNLQKIQFIANIKSIFHAILTTVEKLYINMHAIIYLSKKLKMLDF